MAQLIRYKAALVGITVVSLTEEYTSQTCSVCKDLPSKDNARKANRKHRGLYVCKDCGTVMNADVNGASNIAKKYLDEFCDQSQDRPVVGLGRPRMYRFNGSRFVA
jgi:putative transposase